MTAIPIVAELLALFTRQHQVKEERENHVNFLGVYTSKNLGCPTDQELASCFKRFPARDCQYLSIVVGEGEATNVSSIDLLSAVAVRLEELSQKMQVADVDDEFTFKITIEKKLVSNALTVCSLPAFLEHFKDRTTKECLSIFNGLIGGNDHVVLALQESDKVFGSATIRFEPESALTFSANFDRASILDRLRDIAHFADMANFKLVPDDFTLKGDAPDEWAQLFLRLANTLSMAFIADYSAFESGDMLRFKINGYRVATGVLDCRTVTGSAWGAAFRIYQWVYQGGSSSDKVGLLRNVVTLHLDDKGLPKLDADVFKSVCSSFEIYLKRNVGQYIELKNKLFELLRNLGKDGREEAGKYASAMIQNVGVLLSFFITTIIVNGVSGKGLLNVFTHDITYLTNAFLGGSLVYLALSVFMFLRQRARILKDFDAAKEQYADLLDQEDLHRLFRVEQITEIMGEMRRMAIGISLAWIFIVVGFGVTANVLYLDAASQVQPPVTQTTSSPSTNPAATTNATQGATTTTPASTNAKASGPPVVPKP